ncbi:GNAT family N-acetyltransferase [Uliginosibacterium sp. H1]|uniref:GNAT family N-acetyltransferase n=1 Tax=Uliginosibacterium sp. H1 TaxID=3114757 RepID=UPI002E16CC95|nr:GNAT family N-acetyltransferase [Uliginosibacterium sp. H1]
MSSEFDEAVEPTGPDGVTLRDYRPADAASLAAIYRQAVQVTAAAAYDATQTAAWARFAEDEVAFATTLGEGWVRVAEDADGICGFAQVNLPGHLHLLYVAPRAGRRGVATALLEDCYFLAAAMGAAVMTVDASLVAQPMLLKLGFVVKAEEQVEREGVSFRRFRMEKRLPQL